MKIHTIILFSAPFIFLGSCFQVSTTAQRKNSPSGAADQNTTSDYQIESPQKNGTQFYRVVSVGDGDTIRIEADREKITIRFACIDAAELKQHPYGDQAKQRLENILPINTSVSLKEQTVDRYDRVVAEVFKGDVNINLVLVGEGHAVAYRKYLSQCDSEKYLTAEATAKSKGLAYWSQTNPIMPWDFRRGDRTGWDEKMRSPVANSKKCDRSYPGLCIPPAPPDLDCSDIPYRRFKVIGNDPHRFDGDRDGIGCES